MHQFVVITRSRFLEIESTTQRCLRDVRALPLLAPSVSVGTRDCVQEGQVPSALQNLHYRLLDQAIQHRRDTKLSHPAVRLRDFHPSYRLRLVGSV